MPTAQTVFNELKLDAVKNHLFKLYVKIIDSEFEIAELESAVDAIETNAIMNSQTQDKIAQERESDLEHAKKDLKSFLRSVALLENLYVKHSQLPNASATKRKL